MIDNYKSQMLIKLEDNKNLEDSINQFLNDPLSIDVKNVIDVLGTNVKIYFQGEYKPLFFVNDKDEIGLVLPVKKY